jgi:glycine cleavage system H lipoate-binding protein
MQLPTITINTDQKIVVKRLLPGLGKILVERGQEINALDTVAQIESPSGYATVHVARQLAKYDLNMDKVMLKKVGDMVEANELIATRKATLRTRSAYAPAKGSIVAIGQGWVLLETERTVTQVQAFINGTVTKVVANRGVMIEAIGMIVQASCGFGGEAYGLLKRVVDRPGDFIEADDVDDHAQNTILLAGQSVDEDTLRAAEEHEVRGIIVGSIDAALLTLNPPVKVCVIATEGFGDVPMSMHTFNTLRNLSGREVSVRGITPSLSRPNFFNQDNPQPIILASTGKPKPFSALDPVDEELNVNNLAIGGRVRVTRGPFLGAISTIDSFPDVPQATDIGIVTPGAYLTVDQARRYIPLSNLEQVR